MNPPSACIRGTTELLLGTLDELKRRGNTLLVVEHDEDTMKRADHIVDMGPGAGIHGGRIMAQGTFEELGSHAGLRHGRGPAS